MIKYKNVCHLKPVYGNVWIELILKNTLYYNKTKDFYNENA